MKRYDVISVGEVLIDFIPTEEQVCGGYRAAVGGAPLNVAAGVAKLGGAAALIGRTGADPLGREIRATLRRCGVDCSLLQEDPARHTSVTLVMPRSSDLQRYIIYRDNCADGAIDFAALPANCLSETYLLHAGVLLNTTPDSARRMRMLLEAAHAQGALVSLDVNLRCGCWTNEDEMIRESAAMAELADIIKVTEDEREKMNLPVTLYAKADKTILITDGDRDIHAFWQDRELVLPVRRVPVADVTGAGDAFLSAFLFCYSRFLRARTPIDFTAICACTEAGMRAGCHAVQRIGAYMSYPTYDDLFPEEGRKS